jgi:hypothetical protein
MSLPKITTPLFELTLPSNGTTVKYRPFLVKEQKILLLALESSDQNAIMGAVKQIVNNCAVEPNVDVEKMPMFDLEYFFLRLRAKSIGEDVELNLRHPTGFNSKEVQCDGVTPGKVNLLDVEVEKTISHTDKIILDEENQIGIKFKYPDGEMSTSIETENKNDMELATEAIINCIEYIFDKDNVYRKEDSTKQELLDFIDNLQQEQYLKLSQFFDTMPKLKHKVKWKCTKCQCEDEITLEGLVNFFG